MSRLDEIKARADTATPGPWKTWIWGGADFCVKNPDKEDGFPIEATDADFEFIDNSRSDIDWLIAEVKSLQNALKNIRSILHGSSFDGRNDIEMLIHQALIEKKHNMPNEETAKVLKQSDEGKKLTRSGNSQEFFKQLGI